MQYLALVMAAGVSLGGCSKSETSPSASPPEGQTSARASDQPAAPPRPKDPARARELIASGHAVIDVRTPEEFAEGHVASATHIPLTELPRRLGEVDKLVGGDRSKPIVVYCAAGRRAAQAIRQLEAEGYTALVNGGGLDDLQ